MNNINFNSLRELQEYKNSLKLSEDIFLEYLSKIYTNLLQREEEFFSHSKSIKLPRHSLDLNKKDSFISSMRKAALYNNQTNKAKIAARNISLNNFLDFMDIQEFIGQRIFKYLNKSKSNKLNKNDFCQGLNHLYYGDVNNLIKFTFFLADFNRDGKIYKSDMKLILAYVPSATEFSQKLKVKQINSIINIFFEEKIERNEEDVEKEINYDKYLKYVQEYINNENKNNLKNNSELLNDNYNNNAPFFFFISILSYIFKNCPFNAKNAEFFQFSKKKIKLKLLKNEGRSLSQRKIAATSKKELNFSSYAIGDFTNSSNKLNPNLIGLASIEPKKLNKFIIDAALSKIEQKNLFITKKSSSQIPIRNAKKSQTIKTKLLKRPEKRHDFIVAKDNKNIKQAPLKSKIYQKILNNNLINNKKRLSSNNDENISTKNTSPKINISQSPNLNMTSASPEILKMKNSFNSSHDSNESCSNSTNNLEKLNLKKKISSISISNEKDKTIPPLSVGSKIKNDDKDVDDINDFFLCVDSSGDDSPSKNRKNAKNEENDEENERNSDELFLYKFDDDDFLNKLNKYYAMISEKEILFFSSEKKDELCDLWYLYKTYISTSKEKINGTYYYVIIITYNNSKTNKLYFIDEKICLNFSKRIKNSIKNIEFEEYYEKLEKIGHGHFGKVYKCKSKLTGQIFAAKIINKQELDAKDSELIRQEKNYLNLIKHPNIISLKDYFEDKNFIYFVTEYYNGGDLISFLDKKHKENSKISEKTAAKIIKKIAEGLKYLNFFGIIHRDIKPENIMFAEQNEIKSLKIIDLGVCQTISYGELANEPIGTNGYICPEIYLHHSYSFKVDVWSLGVILYLLITGGVLPFDDDSMDSQIIGKKVIYLQQEYPEKYFENKSKALISLIDKMLEKNDNKRINIIDLIKDNWFGILKK